MGAFTKDTAGTLTTSLISFWKLYTNSNDLVSTNNGTDTDITYSSNKAVFNGSTSNIITSGSGFPTGSGARSISFWVIFDDVSVNQNAFGYGTGTNSGEKVDLYFNPPSSSTQLDLYGWGANTNHSLGTATAYHFVLTYPGSGTVWTIHKNGDAGTSLDIGHTPNTVGTSHKLGQLIYSTGFPLKGKMWDVGIWSKVLSSTEISDLYNGGSGNTYNNSTTYTQSLSVSASASVSLAKGLVFVKDLISTASAGVSLLKANIWAKALSVTGTVVPALARVATHYITLLVGGGSASSGPNSPGTVVDDASVGTRVWNTPGNALSSNDQYAYAAGSGASHYLKATNFGFAIPSGATITGIVVEIERHDEPPI